MPTSDQPCHAAARLRSRPAAAPGTRALAVALLAVSVAAAASALWPSHGLAQQDGSRVPRHPSPALEHAAHYMMALPVGRDSVALAAQGTQEGHWRFVNRVGEMLTVGTPEEMKRVLAVLYPEAGPDARIRLYLTEDTVFRYAATLGALPASAELHMVVRGRSYRLRRSGAGGGRLLADVRPNLAVEPRDAPLFEEVLWHLARPLRDARVRVLALEPGAPGTLAAWPRTDPATGRALVDAVEPARLASAMRSVPGQILLIVGRVEGGVLHVRPARGPERSLPVAGLFEAAADADVNLVVLRTAATPRQPSGRNPLWLAAQGDDAEAVLQRAQVGDLVSGIAGPGRRLAVVASAAGERTVLEMAAGGDAPGAVPARSAAERLSALVRESVSREAVTGVGANLLGAGAQRELDRRFLAGIPAALQTGYAAAVVLGLLGLPVARTWWARAWPREKAAEYAGRGGYWAACAVRGLAFFLAFVPVVAAAAAPWSLARALAEGRAWRWRRAGSRQRDASAPFGRGPERPPFDDGGLQAPGGPRRASGRRAAHG
jgi:hypothetical protein